LICIQTYKEAADAENNNNNEYNNNENNNNMNDNDNDNKQTERKSQHFLLNILRPTFGFEIGQVTNI